ncbi:PQQ-binding-like beta-propeller repeat protein [Actinoplanes sp. NPDC048967]|uniref:PQQ-binding-like beta-propeller repeat protein n=1 Tax=Actinoplanes sp. NPDC048967 TaxID=3155269 RepID=UPI0033D243AF
MVIDLGDASAVPETPPSPGATRRRPMALGLVLLATLALAGAGPAEPPRVRPILVTDDLAGAFTLAPSALFTSSFVGRQALVRRYSLADSSVQWTTALPQSVGDLELAGADVLTVTSPENAQTSFLDSDTGTVLWRRTAGATTVLTATDDSVLMTSAGAAIEYIVLERAALRTGKPLWSRRLDAAGYLDVGDAGRIVTVDRQGRAAVLSLADGTVRATADLGVELNLGRFAGDGDTTRFVTSGDRLYLTRREGGAGSVTAYRLTDLRQLWRKAIPFGWPTGCGAYLCVSTAAGMTVLDAGTGDARWSSTDWRLGADSAALRIPGPARLMVTDARHTARRALLDPATGRMRSMLGHSEQVGALLLRVDMAEPGRTWIQQLGPGDEVRTIGRLDGMSLERCLAVAAYLACANRNGRANVWQLMSDS